MPPRRRVPRESSLHVEPRAPTAAVTPPPSSLPDDAPVSIVGSWGYEQPGSVVAGLSLSDLAALVLPAVVLAVACNINTLKAGFPYDDHRSIYQMNEDLRSGTSVWDMLRNDYWGYPVTNPGSHKSWRPLTRLTFRWQYILHGPDPAAAPFHAANVVLNAAVAGLVAILGAEVFGPGWGPGRLASSAVFAVLPWSPPHSAPYAPFGLSAAQAAALLFAAHPVHCDAVANVVGRAEILAAVGYLGCLCAYFRAMAGSHRLRPARPVDITGGVPATVAVSVDAVVEAVGTGGTRRSPAGNEMGSDDSDNDWEEGPLSASGEDESSRGEDETSRPGALGAWSAAFWGDCGADTDSDSDDGLVIDVSKDWAAGRPGGNEVSPHVAPAHLAVATDTHTAAAVPIPDPAAGDGSSDATDGDGVGGGARVGAGLAVGRPLQDLAHTVAWATLSGLSLFLSFFCKETAIMVAPATTVIEALRWLGTLRHRHRHHSESHWAAAAISTAWAAAPLAALRQACVGAGAVGALGMRHWVVRGAAPSVGDAFGSQRLPLPGCPDTIHEYGNFAANQATAVLRWANYGSQHVSHAALLVYPRWLAIDWAAQSSPVVRGLWELRNAITLLLYAGLLAAPVACLWAGRGGKNHSGLRWDPLVLCWSLILLPFLPASNALFVVGFEVAERVLYLPSIGFCLAAPWLLMAVAPRGRAVLLLLLLPSAVVRTLARNEDFRSDLALWGSLVRDFPGNVMGHASLAEELSKQGQWDAALGELRVAERIMAEWRPGYYLFAMGATLMRAGRLPEARRAFSQWLRVRSRCRGDAGEKKVYQVHQVLSTLHFNASDAAGGVRHYLLYLDADLDRYSLLTGVVDLTPPLAGWYALDDAGDGHSHDGDSHDGRGGGRTPAERRIAAQSARLSRLESLLSAERWAEALPLAAAAISAGRYAIPAHRALAACLVGLGRRDEARFHVRNLEILSEFDALWKLPAAVTLAPAVSEAVSCAAAVVQRYAVESGSRVRDCVRQMDARLAREGGGESDGDGDESGSEHGGGTGRGVGRTRVHDDL